MAPEHQARHQEDYSAMNGEADQGGDTGEAINGTEENLNGHYDDEQQGQNLDQDEPSSHAHGGTNEENGEQMDHNRHEEETKEGTDDQKQVTCLCSFNVLLLPFFLL